MNIYALGRANNGEGQQSPPSNSDAQKHNKRFHFLEKNSFLPVTNIVFGTTSTDLITHYYKPSIFLVIFEVLMDVK